jgi:hypothetical protein
MSGGRKHVNTETGTVKKRNKSKLEVMAKKFCEIFWEKQEGTEEEMKIFKNAEIELDKKRLQWVGYMERTHK